MINFNGIDYIPSMGITNVTYDGYTFELLVDGSDTLNIKNITQEFKRDGQGQVETERLLRREITYEIQSYYSDIIKTRFIVPTRGKQLSITNGTETIIINNVDAIIDSISIDNSENGKNIINLRFDCREKFPDIKII